MLYTLTSVFTAFLVALLASYAVGVLSKTDIQDIKNKNWREKIYQFFSIVSILLVLAYFLNLGKHRMDTECKSEKCWLPSEETLACQGLYIATPTNNKGEITQYVYISVTLDRNKILKIEGYVFDAETGLFVGDFSSIESTYDEEKNILGYTFYGRIKDSLYVDNLLYPPGFSFSDMFRQKESYGYFKFLINPTFGSFNHAIGNFVELDNQSSNNEIHTKTEMNQIIIDKSPRSIDEIRNIIQEKRPEWKISDVALND